MGGYYQARQRWVSSRFSLLQDTLVGAPKARDWLKADKEHPLLIKNKEQKCSQVSTQENNSQDYKIKSVKNVLENNVPRAKEQKENIKIAVKPRLDFNHPAFQPKKQISVFKEELLDMEENTVKMDIFRIEDIVSHHDEDVIERYELSQVFQKWLHDAENPDRLPWNESDAPEHFFVWSKSDRVDPFHGFDWNKSQTGRLFKVMGGRDSRGKIHGKAEITFQNGEEVSGSFIHGQRNGNCVIRSILKGIDHLSGYWVANKLEGFAICRLTDGSLLQGWTRDGVWHGAFRKFSLDGSLSIYGRCRNGKLHGICWKFNSGGGALFGPVDCYCEMSGEDIVYIYPDLTVGLKGFFRQEKMVFGRKVDVIRAWLSKGNLDLEVSSPKKIDEPFRYKESTQFIMADLPLQRDVYESKTVSCKKSRMGYGEGLFLKRCVKAKTVVAFYNGIRLAGMEPDDIPWEDRSYRIMVGDNCRMDIPVEMRDISSYRATMAHKINHSFEPNSEFWEVTHPVFGYIPCVRTLYDLDGGIELTVHYNYMLDDCPGWFSDLWDSLQTRHRG